MISRRAINRFTDEVARRFRPEKVILFGSYAYGKPTPDSDVDLLVVMSHDRRKGRMSLRILEAVDYDFPLDLLVRTPREVEQRLRWGDCFLEEVLRKVADEDNVQFVFVAPDGLLALQMPITT